jgi:hypothetical protein
MRNYPAIAVLLMIALESAASTAPIVRYFKAEHGVAATYVKLGSDGSYRVIDREHMGIFVTDEGNWKQVATVITFRPKDSTKSSYAAEERKHNGKTFLAIMSADAAVGIAISAEDVNKDLDADSEHLPDHVLFKISERTFKTETKETYPFHFAGAQTK